MIQTARNTPQSMAHFLIQRANSFTLMIRNKLNRHYSIKMVGMYAYSTLDQYE